MWYDLRMEIPETCPICLNTFPEQNPGNPTIKKIIALSCEHLFCDVCIRSWLEKRPTCPVCILKIEDDEQKELFGTVFRKNEKPTPEALKAEGVDGFMAADIILP